MKNWPYQVLNGKIADHLCTRSHLTEIKLFKQNVAPIAVSSTGVARTRFAFSEVSGTGLMVAKEVTRRPAMRASFEAQPGSKHTSSSFGLFPLTSWCPPRWLISSFLEGPAVVAQGQYIQECDWSSPSALGPTARALERALLSFDVPLEIPKRRQPNSALKKSSITFQKGGNTKKNGRLGPPCSAARGRPNAHRIDRSHLPGPRVHLEAVVAVIIGEKSEQTVQFVGLRPPRSGA